MPETVSRRWCFTLPIHCDPTGEMMAKLQQMCMEENKIQYLVWGEEKAPTTGMMHYQGYFETFNRMKLSTLTKWFSGKAHLEKARGTGVQNRNYCLGLVDGKEPNAEFWEGGVMLEGGEAKQGKRSDLDKVRDMLKSGEIKNQFDVLEKCSSVGAMQLGFKWLGMQRPVGEREPPLVFWLYGSTGCGKSRESHALADAMFARAGWRLWVSLPGKDALKWFDGYCGQEIAIFDDYRGEDGTFNSILRITDRYHMQVAVKGATTWWLPRIIIITSPKSVRDSFPGLASEDPGIGGMRRLYEEDVGQLVRRLSGGEFNFDVLEEKEKFKESIIQYLQ